MLDRAAPRDATQNCTDVVPAKSPEKRHDCRGIREQMTCFPLLAWTIALILGFGWLAGASAAPPQKKPTPKDGETTTAVSPPAKPPRKGSRKKKERDKYSVEGIADYATNRFLMHTDLSDEESEELLDRLETMLDLISKYWRQHPSGVIEMFVVKDIKKWPDGAIPEEGLKSIQGGAGLTVTRKMIAGDAWLAKAVVYAIADRGTPQHEVVHAYCGQAFGRVGPLWYSEGMAEMGQYWRANDYGVNANPGVIRYLRTTPPKTIDEIVHAQEFTGDSWQNYAWRWALCHLLAHNKNYEDDFSSLGLQLLNAQPGASFDRTFGPRVKEIDFEYKQFLKNIEAGFRNDLCSWDWKSKATLTKNGKIFTCKIEAGKGWQPSKLKVVEGEDYEFSVAGKWNLKEGETSVDADGNADGTGRLIGALLTESAQGYELSEPFKLGKFGSFTSPGSGILFLRCREKWSSIADNRNAVVVKLKLKNKGQPLPPPKEKDADDKKKIVEKNESLNEKPKTPTESAAGADEDD